MTKLLNRTALLGLIFLALRTSADESEFRGFWADAFHPGFTNSADVSKFISDVRSANANAVVVEVRKRGDAYYNSNYEPKAAGIDPKYHPLADLITKGHNTEPPAFLGRT